MNFDSPEELASHLAMTIDDEAFIVKAVRIKFPDWNGGTRRSTFEPKEYEHRPKRVKPDRKSAYAGANYRAINGPDDWHASELADKMFHKMIEQGSYALLHKIRSHHPAIMECFEARGLQVVRA